MQEEKDSLKQAREIEKKVRKVEGAMAQEGMPLTEEIKKMFVQFCSILLGKTTAFLWV